MVKNKYSLIENLYNGKGLLLESGSGMGAQDLVAAYLIKNIPAVTHCTVAKTGSNDEDVIAYAGKKKFMQCEVKHCEKKSSKYSGYAEIAVPHTSNPVAKQFQQDLSFIHPILRPEVPESWAKASEWRYKKGHNFATFTTLPRDTMNQRIKAVAASVNAAAIANPGKVACSVIYGAASIPYTDIKLCSSEKKISGELFGTGGINHAQIAGAEPCSFYRKLYGMIKGACVFSVLVKGEDIEVKLQRIYFAGAEQVNNPAQPWSNYAENQTGPLKATQGSQKKLANGGVSGTKVKTVGTPASMTPSAKSKPKFSDSMNTKYRGDGDNYYCQVDGGRIRWVYIFGQTGTTKMGKKVSKFTCVDQKGSALKEGKATTGIPFGGKSHAVYFTCDTFKWTDGDAALAAQYRNQNKIIDHG